MIEHFISDRDPYFVSAFYKGIMSNLKAWVALSTVYYPQMEG